MIDSHIPKAADSAGFGRRADPLQMAEGLADFGEILVFIFRILKAKKSSTLCCQASDPSSCFLNGHHIFARMNMKLAFLRILYLIGKCVLVSAKSAVFRIW